MRDFIISAALNKDRNFFTEFAGIRTTDLEFSRSIMETEDFATSDRFFIPESGKNEINIAANGVTNLEPEFFRKIFIEIANQGIIFAAKIENTQIVITGNFCITELGFSEDFDSNCQFTISLKNSGSYQINKK